MTRLIIPCVLLKNITLMFPAQPMIWSNLSVEGIFLFPMPISVIAWILYKVVEQWDNGDKNMRRELRKR